MAWVKKISGTTQYYYDSQCFVCVSTFKDEFRIASFILHKATTIVNVSRFIVT